MWLPSNRGVTWRNGRQTVWIMAPEAVSGVLEARQVATQLGVDAGWSVGSVASHLLRWVGPPKSSYKDRLHLAKGVKYSHIHAIPGEYPNCQHYDVSAYYYTLLGTLPCIDPEILGNGRILWPLMYDGLADRWSQVYAAIKDNKWLRNALVGCMVGRTAGRPYYFRGERRQMRGDPGPFATAGQLVVRAAFEITQIAARETDAVWSHTDAVIARDGLYPRIWTDLGFRIRKEGSGETDICNAIIYRCGLDATAYYKAGSRFLEETPLPDLAPILYHTQWLRAG